MKINKLKLSFIFLVSLFLFPIIGNADYQASVIKNTPKCEFSSNASGKCFYSNTAFTAVEPHVVWLDLGDEVYVYENEKITSTNANKCGDYYVKVRYAFPENPNVPYYGYFCHADLTSPNFNISDELKQEFAQAGFPESYYEKLAILKTNHPNWKFKAIDTGLDFSEAVYNERISGRSLIQLSVSNSYAYLSATHDSFDYINNRYLEYDNVGSGNPWLMANDATVAYYMDPRNFLVDMYIFQFESLSYEAILTDEAIKNSITIALSGTNLLRYVDTFLEAGKQSGVNPIYLASLSRQEVGGSVTAIDGAYNGMYNFYNIGATGGANPVINGLVYASYTDSNTLRPWNTPEKGIIGGGMWIAQQYVTSGQNTSYFKRFNVIYNYLKNNNIVANPHQNYLHQYMTNTMAPTSEAVTTYRSYNSTGIIDSDFVFLIPVYKNMPEKTALPNNQGWPNNYLSTLTINGSKVAAFNPETENYTYDLDINNPVMTIGATPISQYAKIDGLKTYTLDKDQTINITVTAQNGNKKVYKINVKLIGEKRGPSVDIKSTLNNAGLKNNDSYISGIKVGTDVKVIKDKIIASNSEAVVKITDVNGNLKESGITKTGDKVNIKLGTEDKTFDIVIYGDVNGDGKVKSNDYGIIVDYVVLNKEINGIYKIAADVNKDGKIKSNDYGIIVDYVVLNKEFVQ